MTGRALWALLVFAGGVRALVAVRTEAPDWDSVHYLWLAAQAGGGDPAQLFDTVFHPLWPALLALFVDPVDPVAAYATGQVVGVVVSTLAVVPVWFAARALFDREVAIWAAVLFAAGTWNARYAADVLTEPLFHGLVALWALGCARARVGTARWAIVAGLAAALAHATRPEGGTLLVVGFAWVWWACGPRRAVCFALGAAPIAVALIAGWATWGPGLTFSSKATFVYAEGVGSGGVGHYLREWLGVPGAILEDQGYLAFPLAVVGAIWLGRSSDSAPGSRFALWLLLPPFLIQCLVAPALRSHYRFYSGYGVLLLPLAGLSLVLVRARISRPALAPWLLGLVVVLPDAIRWPHARRENRGYEVGLGRWLAEQGVARAEFFTDQPRVAFFAGMQPTPPRRWTPAEVAAAVEDTEVRWLALLPRRSDVTEAGLESLGFSIPDLPDALRNTLGRRGVIVARRAP